jgi:hypothetical protein
MPAFSPPVPGSWVKAGPTALTFQATAPFIPTTTETLVIPAGGGGAPPPPRLPSAPAIEGKP